MAQTNVLAVTRWGDTGTGRIADLSGCHASTSPGAALCYLTELSGVTKVILMRRAVPSHPPRHHTISVACRSAISTQVHQQRRLVFQSLSGVLTFLFATSRSHFAPRFRAWQCHCWLSDPSIRRLYPLPVCLWTDINSKKIATFTSPALSVPAQACLWRSGTNAGHYCTSKQQP
jgi:hypothetical protein